MLSGKRADNNFFLSVTFLTLSRFKLEDHNFFCDALNKVIYINFIGTKKTLSVTI